MRAPICPFFDGTNHGLGLLLVAGDVATCLKCGHPLTLRLDTHTDWPGSLACDTCGTRRVVANALPFLVEGDRQYRASRVPVSLDALPRVSRHVWVSGRCVCGARQRDALDPDARCPGPTVLGAAR